LGESIKIFVTIPLLIESLVLVHRKKIINNKNTTITRLIAKCEINLGKQDDLFFRTPDRKILTALDHSRKYFFLLILIYVVTVYALHHEEINKPKVVPASQRCKTNRDAPKVIYLCFLDRKPSFLDSAVHFSRSVVDRKTVGFSPAGTGRTAPTYPTNSNSRVEGSTHRYREER
jgi:hypothetical protein